MTFFLLLALAAPTGIEIEPIHHGSLVLKYQGKVIHVDPWSRGNYEGVAKADLILITDIHSDHMDPDQIQEVTKRGSVIIAPEAVQKTVTEARILRNGETTEVLGIRIEAIPMYNLKRGPGPGKLYHTKGRGNGYLLTLGQERVYVSGDTECVPEIRALKNVDAAFICMNLPYTMTPPGSRELRQQLPATGGLSLSLPRVGARRVQAWSHGSRHRGAHSRLV